MSNSDQPVQVSHQDQFLCHPEGWNHEHVTDASHTQQPVPVGPHSDPSKDEQADGSNGAKQFVNIRNIDLDQENQKPAPRKEQRDPVEQASPHRDHQGYPSHQ
jgi:hypothetical protein